MKLNDFGGQPTRDWFLRLIEWSRKRISFEDNIDGVSLIATLNTTETVIEHPLGRTPRDILEVASYPHGTAGISFTREPTATHLYLTRSTAGTCKLWLM